MKLKEVPPTGYSRGPAFVSRSRGCTLEDVRVPCYSRCPEARDLYDLRRDRGIGLRDAASKIGIRAVELSGLERGSLVPENRDDWARILWKLEE